MSDDQRTAPDSLSEAIEAFWQMRVPPAPPDADVRARLAAPQDGTARPVSDPRGPTRRGRLTRFLLPSVAALLAIGLVGLSLLSGTTAVALADVVKAAEKHKLVRYREQLLTGTADDTAAPRDSTVHADLTAPRLRSEIRVADPDGEAVFLSVHDGRRHLATDAR